MTTTTITLEKRNLKIYNNDMTAEILIKGSGQNVKCFLSINNKIWTSWNLSNYKMNPNDTFNDVKNLLLDGSYKMFL